MTSLRGDTSYATPRLFFELFNLIVIIPFYGAFELRVFNRAVTKAGRINISINNIFSFFRKAFINNFFDKFYGSPHKGKARPGRDRDQHQMKT